VNLRRIATQLSLLPMTAEENLDREVGGCYAGDLLSAAMAAAHKGDVWLTVQYHANVVAIAVLLDLAAVVVTGGGQPDLATTQRANDEGVVLLGTNESTYTVAGQLWALGIRASE
jgi:predicted transcriptional regulator